MIRTPSSPAFNASQQHIDILLVTVTEVEVRAVLEMVHTQFGRDTPRWPIADKTYYDLGTIGGAKVAMVQSEIGSGGLGAALLTVQKGIDALSPIAVIMVGVAFGINPKKQRIGDVLVSRQLMVYEPQQVRQTTSGKTEIRARGDRSPASPVLLDRFRSGKLDWEPLIAAAAPASRKPPEVHFGLIVSGEKLVDNLAFREQLRQLEPLAIGGEMEGAGLYVAAEDRKVEWILVKAICDWADGNKHQAKQQRQKLAAHNAAHFVFHVLNIGGIARPSKPNRPPVPVLPTNTNQPPTRVIGNAPPMPKLMIGRDDDVQHIKQRLGIGTEQAAPMHVLTAMKGWPGVGKTTLASALAYDDEVGHMFPDGVLWASIGQQPNLFAELAAWGRALGIHDLTLARTTQEVTARLAAVLRTKQMLLIVDDVWEAQHVEPFRVGGPQCALLITTRRPDVAIQVAPTADNVYTLGVLSAEKALELLQKLAPKVVAEHQSICEELVKDLEGLPLAIQVAGRLLQTEHSYGFSVTTLLEDIRAGAKIIEAKAPPERSEIANDTTPTIAALLDKSTNLLDPPILDCFAYLGVFAPKPATFDPESMKSVWMVEDPKPIIRILIDHGLLESVAQERYWMHAILVSHAKSFLTDD